MSVTSGGLVNIGTVATADRLLTLRQKADSNGFRVYGFDDRSTAYFDMAINANGFPVLTGSGGFVFFNSNFSIFDNQYVRFGGGGNNTYFHEYDSSNTRFDFWSNDIDGAGADGSIFTVDDGTDDVRFYGSIGIGVTPSAKVHVLSTTEQARFGYDASNYLSITVNSSGIPTFAPTGIISEFTGTIRSMRSSGTGSYTSIDTENGAANLLSKNPTSATYAQMLFLQGNNTTNREVARFNSSGFFGIGTSTPTHALTLPVSSTGIAIYNTANQTTDYERFTASWNSNVLELGNTNLGSTSVRALRFGVAGTTGGAINRYLQFTGSLPFFAFNFSGTGLAGAALEIGTNSSFIGSTTHQKALRINPTINQSGSASYTALEIDITETATGSGNKRLADFMVGSSSKFIVENTGAVGIGGTPTAILDVNSTTSGILFPRMTATQGSAVTGINGMVIYVTDTNGTFTSVGFWGYEAGAWVKL
jgi:hypothetical protein